MEIDSPDEGNESMPRTEENGSLLRPILSEESGEGLPYAPVNWPNPGDIWGWRVGRRVASTGHHRDRYLYLPRRLRQSENPMRKKHAFASKLSVEQYVRTAFPGADINAFFASFSWKIPATKSALTNGHVEWNSLSIVHSDGVAEHNVSDPQADTVGCKAGNKMCTSILEQIDNPHLAAMPCNLCCSEPRFCLDCCCILCSKTINLDYGGYSYIKCEAAVDEDYICGHIAHVDCALRCYMAGTVGGSIGLDAEYYCRRCDARTDLVPHATKLLQACESIDSRDDIDKILSVGVCILRDSKKTSAKRMLHLFELAMAKLKLGTALEDIWKLGDKFLPISEGFLDHGNAALEIIKDEEPLDVGASSEQTMSIAFDPWMLIKKKAFDLWTESLKLEDEVDRVLLALRKSQESEYKIVEERLYAQKNYLLNLYQQLHKERSELAHRTSSADPDSFLDCVLNRVEQIKRELKKLSDMEKVATGFGKTSKGILKEHFGLETED